MASKGKPSTSVQQADNKGVVVGGDAVGNIIQTGDHNTVNQNFFQRIFITLFKPDTETLDQRNRRILLNHVENFWVKGVLEKSLHGAAMLELGIKEDPEAVTYPWAIKKESTGETLPAGTSMQEIFDQIGMGRSLLILGAPGSGKTTMLLELARQLIERARQNADEPIPMVFNLASWTEKLSLADWLAQVLNNIYYVPRRTAPDWVKGNKLLLLLDGLDEVRQEIRAKCVDAINQFRKEHGLTSLAVCSRSQDYEELGAKLAFEGAIEVQPLTQKQVNEFFNRFGKEMAGLKSVLKKDSALREMAESPLFLSIMVMAYRDKRDVDISVSQDSETQRRYLFNNYIEKMFKHPRPKSALFSKTNVTHWLSWLSSMMGKHDQIPYSMENMQPEWLNDRRLIRFYRVVSGSILGLVVGLIFGYSADWIIGLGAGLTLVVGLTTGLISGTEITTIDTLYWYRSRRPFLLYGLSIGLIAGLIIEHIFGMSGGLLGGIGSGISIGLMFQLRDGLVAQQKDWPTRPGQRIVFTMKNFSFIFLFSGLIFALIDGFIFGLFTGLKDGLANVLTFGVGSGLSIGVCFGLIYGGFTLIQHYTLRFILARNNILPWKLIPFLDYCTDLIFLRRVGGGYIFVHRLLMEHFAAMYKDGQDITGLRDL
jgi:DNA polymerase III delta prime subunit